MLLREDLLNDFCRSVDAMDEESFNKFRALVLKVLSAEFGTVHSDIKLDGRRASGIPALDTMRLDAKPKDYNLVPVKDERGHYTSQRAFSYDLGCPLWITTKCGSTITGARASDVLIEQWGEFDGDFSQLRKLVPKYQDFEPEGGGARTSVIVPLRYGASRPRVFGVLCLEFKAIIERSQHTARRIATLSRAIAKAIWIFETTREQRQGTLNALDALEKLVDDLPRGPGLHLPKVFFAYPSQCDMKVRDAIAGAVSCWPDSVQLEDWGKKKEAGPISEEITKSINSATYGICYFSQPSPERAELAFFDNANVLIEAGMMNAAFHTTVGSPSRWLLVRENHEGDPPLCSEPPFDIKSQRFVIVPRTMGKTAKAPPELDRDTFLTDLMEHLENLFAIAPSLSHVADRSRLGKSRRVKE